MIMKSMWTEIFPIILEEFYKNRPIRIYTEYCPTIRSGRDGLLVISECKADGEYE